MRDTCTSPTPFLIMKAALASVSPRPVSAISDLTQRHSSSCSSRIPAAVPPIPDRSTTADMGSVGLISVPHTGHMPEQPGMRVPLNPHLLQVHLTLSHPQLDEPQSGQTDGALPPIL